MANRTQNSHTPGDTQAEEEFRQVVGAFVDDPQRQQEILDNAAAAVAPEAKPALQKYDPTDPPFDWFTTRAGDRGKRYYGVQEYRRRIAAGEPLRKEIVDPRYVPPPPDDPGEYVDLDGTVRTVAPPPDKPPLELAHPDPAEPQQKPAEEPLELAPEEPPAPSALEHWELDIRVRAAVKKAGRKAPPKKVLQIAIRTDAFGLAKSLQEDMHPFRPPPGIEAPTRQNEARKQVAARCRNTAMKLLPVLRDWQEERDWGIKPLTEKDAAEVAQSVAAWFADTKLWTPEQREAGRETQRRRRQERITAARERLSREPWHLSLRALSARTGLPPRIVSEARRPHGALSARLKRKEDKLAQVLQFPWRTPVRDVADELGPGFSKSTVHRLKQGFRENPPPVRRRKEDFRTLDARRVPPSEQWFVGTWWTQPAAPAPRGVLVQTENDDTAAEDWRRLHYRPRAP